MKTQKTILVYIAGKYRGNNQWETWQNIRTAEEAGAELIKNHPEFFPIIPHKNTCFYDGLRDEAYFRNGDLELLKRCDYIFMLPNWTESKGATAEYLYAKKRGIKEIK